MSRLLLLRNSKTEKRFSLFSFSLYGYMLTDGFRNSHMFMHKFKVEVNKYMYMQQILNTVHFIQTKSQSTAMNYYVHIITLFQHKVKKKKKVNLSLHTIYVCTKVFNVFSFKYRHALISFWVVLFFLPTFLPYLILISFLIFCIMHSLMWWCWCWYGEMPWTQCHVACSVMVTYLALRFR